MLSTREIYLMRVTGRRTICNFGGGSKSSTSTASSSTTNNDVTSTDMRNVASDSAVSISGSGNNIDRSSSSVTSFMDYSDRSTLTSFVDKSVKDSSTHFSDTSNRSTNFSDSSDRSTTFTDNSDRSVTNINTDFGSVNGSLSLAGAMTTRAFDVAGLGINGAIDVLKLESSNGLKALSMAYESVDKQAALTQASSAANMGFARDALQATQDAMQTARDGGESKIMMAAIGAVAVVAVAVALK